MKKTIVFLVLLLSFQFAFGGLIIRAETLSEGMYEYTVENGKAIITKCNDKSSKEIIIPSTIGNYPVIEIGNYAFNNNYTVEKVIISTGIKNINQGAFTECSNINSLSLPDTVEKIGPSAFAFCSKLQEIQFPSSLSIVDYASFRNCESLTSIYIRDNIKIIEKYAFEGCKNLNKITIGNGVTEIQHTAFKDCNNINEVVFGNKNLMEKFGFIFPSNVKKTYPCFDGIDENHKFDKTTVLKEPTATETGLKISTCIVCGEEKEETLPKKTVESTNSNQNTNTVTSEYTNNSTTSANETLSNNTSSAVSNQSIISSSKEEHGDKLAESNTIQKIKRENKNLKIFICIIIGAILVVGAGIGSMAIYKFKKKASISNKTQN